MLAVVPTYNNKHQRGISGSLARINLFGCVLVRRPALIRFQPYLGRGEAGGEDSMCFPVSDYNP